MRILLLMDPFIPIPPENYGGIERIVYDLANEYVKNGHRVTIVAGPNSKSPDRLITYGKNGPLNPNLNFKNLWLVYNILKTEIPNHDVIHNFGRLAFLVPFFWNKIPKVQSYLREVSRSNIINADLLSPVNLIYTAVSNAIKKTGETAKSRWETVYNCAPIDQFTYKADTPADSYLCFVGRFERVKGLHNAIKVAKLTNKQLIIAGFISHIQHEKRYYEKEIKPYIDGKQIKWIGEVNNAQRNELYRGASALLTPVEWVEPFPVIIPESYACGTPVLGFNLGGIPEGIDHGVTGYISSTVKEMAGQVLKIDKLSRAACRAKAEREYSAEKIANDYFKLYQPKTALSSSLKILLIMDPGIAVPPQFYGGIERIVYMLANEYIKNGHRVTLLAGPGSYCDGTTVIFGKTNNKPSELEWYQNILSVWKYLKRYKNQFDMIHNFGRLLYLLPVLNHPSKKIMSYQRLISADGIRFTNALPNKNLTFTACSDNCAASGNVAGEWRTVYNCVDFSKYDFNNDVDSNSPFMFLGRLDKIKGLHTAIAAVLKTNNKLIIGGNIPTTDDNYQYYKNEIEPLFDNEQIVYLGALNDEEKNRYLRQSKALLFPIEWEEPFGIVMVEAMACGTPVIGFKRGAVPEVVDEGITGNIVTDIDGMINAINNIEKIDRLKCREQAEKRFNVAKIANDYLSI
ncbi:glycosyltransferase [Mucilaginibacter puniceus]